MLPAEDTFTWSTLTVLVRIFVQVLEKQDICNFLVENVNYYLSRGTTSNLGCLSY